jgi:hypothetical protein
MNINNGRTWAAFAAGLCVGLVAEALFSAGGRPAVAQVAAASATTAPSATELETIKGKLTDQSHVMQDVGYHFTNLWFAAQKQNWPLATFYNQETLSHLHWAVRIIPVRKDSTGADVKLEEILQAFETGPWKKLQESIAAQDGVAFEQAYRFSIEFCYACHKAADKPFLRPQIPTEPAATIINFEPSAKWPP